MEKLIIEQNLGLCINLVNDVCCANPRYDRDVLLNIARATVVKAHQTFDSSKGSFSYYASKAIKWALYDEIRANGNTIKTPRDKQPLVMQGIINVFSGADHPRKNLEIKELNHKIDGLVKNLPELHKKVIVLKYFNQNKVNLKEIADILGKSYQYIKEIHINALKIVKEGL